MKNRTLNLLIAASLALTAILCTISLIARYKVESRNKSVAIAADYQSIEDLAAGQGLTIQQALKVLYTDGLSAVVLPEDTVGDLLAQDRFSVKYPYQQGGQSSKVGPTVSGAPDDIARLVKGVGIRYGSVVTVVDNPDGSVQLPGLTPDMLQSTPLGIDREASKRLLEAHLIIIARMNNPVGISPQTVAGTIAWAHDCGASIFLPEGEQVLGRKDALKTLAESLQQEGMLYATPEFSKIAGDSDFVQATPELVVRLHSALTAELDKLPVPEAIDRFVRAARERGMRILLVRPINYAASDPLTQFGTFIHSIARGVISQGHKLGAPHPMTDPNLPKPLFLLIGLAIVPAAWAFMKKVYEPMANPFGVLALLLGIACYSPHYRHYDALFAAIIFPILSYVLLEELGGKSVVVDFVRTLAVSFVGGLCVAGLLNSLPYYIRAEQFIGVKAAVFLPILAGGLYLYWRMCNLEESIKSPITWSAGIVTLIVLAALLIMLSRTGNDNAPISGTELKIRDLLDKILFVRPRTKSFVIGIPALVLGLNMLRRLRSSAKPTPQLAAWTVFVLVVAAIGQTDIVDTMCHIHTPVVLSLQRIGVAIAVGAILGIILNAAVNAIVLAANKSRGPELG